MKIALRLEQKLVDRSCVAEVGTKTLLAVANLIRVLKYGDKPIPNAEIAEVFQRARRVATSRVELAKLCQEATVVFWQKNSYNTTKEGV